MEIVATEPLEIREAIALSNEYQHLKGNVAISENSDFEVVDCVCIAPYSEMNKLHFLRLYKETKDAANAMCFYAGSEYDVVLVLRELVPIGDFYYKVLSLRDYLENAGGTIITSRKQ